MQNRPVERVISENGHTLVVMDRPDVEVPAITFDRLPFPAISKVDHDPFKHYILAQAAIASARSSVNGDWPDIYVERMRGAFAKVLGTELFIPRIGFEMLIDKSRIGRFLISYAVDHALGFRLEQQGCDINPQNLVVETENIIRLLAAGVFDDMDPAIINCDALQRRVDEFYRKFN